MTDTETNPPTTTSFSVPEPYQGKGWVEKIKSTDDLWKTLDNAQSLIGKKSVPAQDATDEEWERFYNQAGRPESPDKYTLPDIEGLKDVDLGEQKKIAMDLFHKAGLNTRQAQKLWKEYIGTEMGIAEKSKASKAENDSKLDKEFEEIKSKVFGEEYEAKSQQALGLINKHAPEELKDALKEIGNNPKAMAAVIATLSAVQGEIDSVKKQYAGEDGLKGRGDQTGGAQSIESVRKELASLRTSQAAKDFTHADHKATMEKVSSLAEKVRNYYNK